MSKKNKQTRKPEGALSVEAIVLTFTSNDGKVIKQYVSDPSFLLLDNDSETHLSKKAKELLNLHADRISRDIDNWRVQNV